MMNDYTINGKRLLGMTDFELFSLSRTVCHSNCKECTAKLDDGGCSKRKALDILDLYERIRDYNDGNKKPER